MVGAEHKEAAAQPAGHLLHGAAVAPVPGSHQLQPQHPSLLDMFWPPTPAKRAQDLGPQPPHTHSVAVRDGAPHMPVLPPRPAHMAATLDLGARKDQVAAQSFVDPAVPRGMASPVGRSTAPSGRANPVASVPWPEFPLQAGVRAPPAMHELVNEVCVCHGLCSRVSLPQSSFVPCHAPADAPTP